MSAFNVVRFRVKPGYQQSFIDAHSARRFEFKGFLGGNLIRTGDQTFCLVGEWRDFKSLAAARAEMIAVLDSFRDLLEDLGAGLGVTDPVSGESIVKLAPFKAAKKTSKRKSAKKTGAKKDAKKGKKKSKKKKK